ncbi:MAG: ketoacyl-ACP synthase III [Sandaracinaceae bacterium]|nr:MAG: ketoacyl-ACP synthase III [Sandaracinaceae bacterium]
MTRQTFSALVSTGMFVPSNEVPNAALRERYPEFVDKVEAPSGITTRFHAADDEATSDLAAKAGRAALQAAGLDARDVDLVIVGTDTPDHLTPSTSVIVQHRLGAERAGTFDVGCACASFPTALATASGLIATNPSIRNVLVIGAYLMHRLADPDDPMFFFYGDGAGAAVVRASEQQGLVASAFRANGAHAHQWLIQSGGTREPATHASIDAGRTKVRMVEKYPREINEEGWPMLFRTVCDRAGWKVDEVDLGIFTQVRRSQIMRVAEGLGLGADRTHCIMQKWGYTGSACIPMALHDALAEGRLSVGDKVVLVGSGVGYNQSAVALRVTEDLVGARP